jgi:LuxR family maltose regulon positive regulatory protein
MVKLQDNPFHNMSEMKSAPSHSSDKLLHTKLMPPRLPSTAVPRAELLARLDLGLAKKVMLLVAPTGFGKTTLVRMWIAT